MNFPPIYVQIRKTGPLFPKQQTIMLCDDISEEEIYEGMKSISNDKAPGIDGYNAFFL